MRARCVLVAAALVSFAFVGCAKPRQLGGSIAVNGAGLPGRLAAFCRLQDPSAAGSTSSSECLAEPLE
jgi:hypothetical protein